LWLLVKASGKLFPEDYILETVWSGVVVEENKLQTQMSAIRRALGPDRDMIRTAFALATSPSDQRSGFTAGTDSASRVLA